MKKLIILSVAVLLFSCKKTEVPEPAKGKQPKNKSCKIDINLFEDVNWLSPDTTMLANLKFASDGKYYQQSKLKGDWSLSNGCDSVLVHTSSTFYYRIVYVKDSLVLINPLFGQITFRK